MNESSPTPHANATFEEAFRRIEVIVEKMNKGQVPLEEAVKLYEEAEKLIKVCQQKLTLAEQKIEMVTKKEGSSESLSPPSS